MKFISLFVGALAGAAGCNGTTGGGLVTFTARAGGASDVAGAPIEFDSGSCYHVALQAAKLHLGAVYLNLTQPLPGAGAEACVEPGVYVGQAFGDCSSGACGVDLDLTRPDLVTFPIPGEGTVNEAREGEIWLTGGDINALDDPTHILEASGTATCSTAPACAAVVAGRACTTWPFTAVVTIGKNRATPEPNVATPGANPICHQRIVNKIVVDFTLHDGGTLDLRVDPRQMWNGVDFASLPATGGTYVIPDKPGGVGGALYAGVRSNSGVYQLTWTDKAP